MSSRDSELQSNHVVALLLVASRLYSYTTRLKFGIVWLNTGFRRGLGWPMSGPPLRVMCGNERLASNQ